MIKTIKTLYNLGDGIDLDDAADFVEDIQESLECLVNEATNVYDGYFNAISLSIEGAISSGSSLSYAFGISVDESGNGVIFYTRCNGFSLSTGIDGALGLTFAQANPDDGEVEYEASAGFDVGFDVSLGYSYDFSNILDPDLTGASA